MNYTTSYYSDCSSKCSAWSCDSGYNQSGSSCIKNDPCDNRTAVISSCPSNASCSYYSDCSSKISSWSCKSGYSKSPLEGYRDKAQVDKLLYKDGYYLDGRIETIAIFPRNNSMFYYCTKENVNPSYDCLLYTSTFLCGIAFI